MELQTPLERVLRSTTEYLRVLEGMGIRTVQDLLLYLPRSHEDLRRVATLATAPLGEKVTLRGTIEHLKLIYLRSRKKLVRGRFTDTEGGVAEVLWFNQPHILRMLGEGGDILLTGKIMEEGRRLQIHSPTFERPSGRPPLHAGRLVPIYPQHDRITSRWLREKIALLRPAIALLPETLPQEVMAEEGLLSRCDAICALHFPEDPSQVQRALDRMAFEEMYDLQCKVLEQKRLFQGKGDERLRTPMDSELIRDFFASLKFTPTASQKVAIYEILKDLEKDRPMSRLLEGDVGSGKTLVAMAVMANVMRHGGQCALMVPTEVLAKQHLDSIGQTFIRFYSFLVSKGRQVFSRHPVVALLTGSVAPSQREALKRGLLAGMVDMVIGTHALIEEDVEFSDLRLVIVDEQHRFGVAQRQALLAKGNPHFLSMTATPIPRTLALTAYGHHDLSVLLEKPGQRHAIATRVVSPKDRKVIERFIDQEIQRGRQVFVICPLILESSLEEMADVRSVEAEIARLRQSFPKRRIAMLHGKMTPSEKEETMRAFRERQYDLLVSTAVIEVGIDIPNASIMVIEGSERFGLSQLHQFRGRVGRGEHRSFCFLFTTDPVQARSPRLKAMEKYQSGFELAEIDLRLRGPGELYGFRQSGLADLRFGGLLNPKLLMRARRAAEKHLGLAPSPVALT